MKLELKHLAPYLPYKLNFYVEHLDGTRMDNWVMGIDTNLRDVISFQNKPILRPMESLKVLYISEFAKYIVELDDRYTIVDAVALIEIYKLKPLDMPYVITEKLFEWHFDVFGLIPSGLAIDLNTL